MKKKYKIDKEKNIGNVIFVVEGGRPETGGTELRLIKSIFADILGYEVKELRRGSDEFIGYGKNPFSQVYALNLPKNQLTQLNDSAMDELFARIKEEFPIKPEDCPLFLIYDRDYLSYGANELRGKYVCKYIDPYSSNDGNQGQLLLSYPSIEAFLLSCNHDDTYKKRFLLGKDIKPENDSCGMKPEEIIDASLLVHATMEMDKGLNSFGIDSYDLDDLKDVLIKVYDREQKTLVKDKSFEVLSLVSMALLELGIIVEDEEE